MNFSFLNYYKGAVFHPQTTFETLIADKRILSLSLRAVFIMATLYTFVYVFLIFGGGRPFKPWLSIPLEIYYQYNVFFCAPSMLLGWILAAGVVHMLSRMVTLAGTFEQISGVLGFGIGVASWATGFHDLLSSFLGAVHVISQPAYEIALNTPTIWRTLLWIQMILYLVWFVVLFSMGVKTVYRLKLWQSVVFGTTGFLIYQGFFLIFNR